MPASRTDRRGGFTLIEILIVIALAAVVLSLTVPSFKRLIVDQRLKGFTQQLVTDLQFARAEAATRNMPVLFSYRATGTESCYVIYTNGDTGAFCNCATTCTPVAGKNQPQEIRKVRMPFDTSVRLTAGPLDIAFDNVNGGLVYGTTDFASPTPVTFIAFTQVVGDSTRRLQTTVSPAGRPTVCNKGTTLISGYAAC